MYGRYDYSFHFSTDFINAGIEPFGSFFRYYRQIPGEGCVEKNILSGIGKIVVNPVEPLNLPKEVTNYLEIEFKPLFVEPFSEKEIYLLFPIEIAVFVDAKDDIEILDIFSLRKPKYSLYGAPSEGVVTRWVFSDVFVSIPEVNRNMQGVLKLNIDNPTKEWVEISRVVFESYGMKIYYGDIVSMNARMKIISKNIAETEFFDRPLQARQNKSIELYTARDLPVVKRGFLMEWGFV